MSAEKSKYYLAQKEIQEFLPHRYPFLLVDRVLEISGPNPMEDDDLKNKIGIKVVAIKNVSMNEPYFTGHFPQMPIMPGVLIIETMAQAAAFSVYPSGIQQIRKTGTFECVLVGVNEARFRVPVVPGDQLRIETVVTKCRTHIWSFDCKAFVEDKLVAEAQLMANLVSGSGEKTK